MGGCCYRVFLKKWPGPQTGVHLWEVSAYVRCQLVGVRLYCLAMSLYSTSNRTVVLHVIS